MSKASTPVDGRRARRERNLAAVIQAHNDLVLETGTRPTPDAVAARADVSVASLFRYFETLDDLQQRAMAVYFERFGALFEVPDIGEGTTDERLRRFVDARLRLHDTVAPIARSARIHAHHEGLIATRLAEVRASLADQVRLHFAPELERVPHADAERRADAVDALTSFESFDLLLTGHGRSTREIRKIWITALEALLVPDEQLS